MKKIAFSILGVLLLILVFVVINISDRNIKNNENTRFNIQFENFSGKTIYGADVLTIINKAIDNNEENAIQRDENGLFIANDENSVKIELILLSTDSEGKVNEVTYQMENLEKADLNKFVSSFGLTKFECTSIEYNSKKRVSKIYVKQLEL